jgi:CubicO group peptidase (beta-lactamase class C family)
MQETIFGPLGMTDTGFYVPTNKVERLSQVYTVDKTGETVPMPYEPLGDFKRDPEIHNG